MSENNLLRWHESGDYLMGDVVSCDSCRTYIDVRNTPQRHDLMRHGFLCEPCQERIDDDQ